MMLKAHIDDRHDEMFEPVRRDARQDGLATIEIMVPAGPETLWPAIRKFEAQPFTARDICRAANSPPGPVEVYLRQLHAAGFVAVAGETQDRQQLWHLTSKRHYPPFVNARGEAHHGHEVASRIWRALKMGKDLTLSALCACVSDHDFQVPSETARLYVNALARAGYLKCARAEQECGEKRYRLLQHMLTGPVPPRLLRVTLVFDPNRQAIAGAPAMAEEVRL